MPLPIIPAETMPSFNNIDFAASDQPVQELKSALRNLPLENYILLGTLCQHLSNLADYESCTKMNISNLGLIFCPTLHIGSILFKNLLGGDGSEDERRKSLLAVWEDLDRRHEEMENIQMIKDFEMGLEFEKDGDQSQQNGASRVYETDQRQERGLDNSQNTEQVDRDLLDFSSSPPLEPPLLSTPSSSSTPFQPSLQTSVSALQSKGNSGSRPSPNDVITIPTEQPPLDLYDELMTREINEATNTPLIDLIHHDLDKCNMDPPENVLRRHAREPAVNRRSESPPPFRLTTRHERLPAVSIR